MNSSNVTNGATVEQDKASSESSTGLPIGDQPTYSLSQEQQLTPIHTLPNEILDQILCFLDIRERIRCEAVCRRWRWVGQCRPWSAPSMLIFDPSRLEKTDMGSNFDLTDSVFTAVLSRCGSSIRQLTISDRVGPECGLKYLYQVSTTERALKLIGKYCPNLMELEIGGIPLTVKGLKRVAIGCRSLKTVRLCMFYSKRVNVEGLAGFYERCQSLESLTLELPHEVDGLEKISRNLHVLRLEKCAGKGLKPFHLQNIMSKCNYIQEIALSDYDESTVDPKLLLHVLNHYKGTLKVLESIIGHPKKTCFNWCAALQMLHKLEKFTLCTLGIKHECVRHFPSECFEEISKNLQFLDLRGSLYEDVNEQVLVKLLKKCNNLCELRLSICSNVSPEFLKRCLKFVDTLKVLEATNISSCCCQDWREAFAVLLNLQEIQLDFCRDITDEVMRTLAHGCVNLKSLRVRSTDITDVGLIQLASLPFLAVLDVSNSSGVTGRGIEVLAIQGRLEELYVASCSKRTILNMTDDDCSMLARVCPNFRYLDVSSVSGTKKISNQLVTAFGESLQKGVLKKSVTLIVGGTSVTKDVRTYPKLDVLFEFSILLPRSFTRTRRRF